MLQISDAEYAERLERLQVLVREAALDAFLVTAFDSIYYLTGAGFEPLERPFFLVVFPDRTPVLVVPKLDQEHMKAARGVASDDVRAYWEYPARGGRGWGDVLREMIGGRRTLGVEPTLRREIADGLSEYHLHTSPLIEKLRLIKSAAEIEMIRRTARYAGFGVQRLLRASYYGSTVAEGYAQSRVVTSRIIRDISDWQPLTTRVVMATWAAPHSARPHSIPDLNDRLRDGPHVALVLTRVNGYAAECERTYFTTRPSIEAAQAYGAMLEARRLALDMIRPGRSAAEIDEAAGEFLCGEGYSGEDRRLHRTGHGIGLSSHEAPFLATGSAEVLAENMVISIEPGIYLAGVGGFRHSDTVRVTRDGAELLTHAPADLATLTLGRWRLAARFMGLIIRRKLNLREKRIRPRLH